MNDELKLIFEFQILIIEMQDKIIQARTKGTPEEVLQESIVRIDKLIEIYKHFDKFYYNAWYYQELYFKANSEKMDMAKRIDEQQIEIDKLTKTLNFA